MDISYRGARCYALIVYGRYKHKAHGRAYWYATERFYNVLRDRYGFWDINIFFLIHGRRKNETRVNGISTKRNIRDVINIIKRQAQPQDIVVFYFVGHGSKAGDNSCLFAASDIESPTDKDLFNDELNHWASELRSEHQIWTFSQCNSGGFATKCAKSGRTILTSCTIDEGNAMPWAEGIRDAFNYARGADTNGDGLISFAEAYNFARNKQIKHYGSVAELKEHSQYCDCGCNVPTTRKLPFGRHGRVGENENLGQEFGQIQTWTGKASDGKKFYYSPLFHDKAVVVCSAHKGTEPLLTCAVDNTSSGFTLSIKDRMGRSARNVDVAWVAFLPNGNNKIQAKCHWIKKSKQRIKFSKKFNRMPIIVCNAQRKGQALLAGTTKFSTSSFEVIVSNAKGEPISGSWLLWIASEPKIERPNLRVSGGYMANIANTGLMKIYDPDSAKSRVIISSAAWDNVPKRAYVRPASGNHVHLTVYQPYNLIAARDWKAHYLSFAD